MSLDGSQTIENLKAAFAGESQANRRYLYFAKVADVEGYPDIAVVVVVHEREQQRETVAVLEAHATALTDFKGAVDFVGQALWVPVDLVRRVVGQARGGGVRD